MSKAMRFLSKSKKMADLRNAHRGISKRTSMTNGTKLQ